MGTSGVDEVRAECANNRREFYCMILRALASKDPEVKLEANDFFACLSFVATPNVAALIHDYMSLDIASMIKPVDANLELLREMNWDNFLGYIRASQESRETRIKLPKKFEGIVDAICEELGMRREDFPEFPVGRDRSLQKTSQE